nr:hypothetical protein Iba_chr09cCG10990 [Ipomoea batatas]
MLKQVFFAKRASCAELPQLKSKIPIKPKHPNMSVKSKLQLSMVFYTNRTAFSPASKLSSFLHNFTYRVNLDHNPIASSLSGSSTGSLNLPFSLSSSNASTRFWSLATNSMSSEVNVAKDKALAFSGGGVIIEGQNFLGNIDLGMLPPTNFPSFQHSQEGKISCLPSFATLRLLHALPRVGPPSPISPSFSLFSPSSLSTLAPAVPTPLKLMTEDLSVPESLPGLWILLLLYSHYTLDHQKLGR